MAVTTNYYKYKLKLRPSRSLLGAANPPAATNPISIHTQQRTHLLWIGKTDGAIAMYSHNDFEKQAKERPYYAVRCCDLLHAPAIFFSRLDVAPLLEHDRDISMDYKACETMLEAFEYIVCDMLSPTKFPSRPPAATAAITDISLPKSASLVPINFTTRFTYAYNLSHFPPLSYQQPCLLLPDQIVTPLSPHQTVPELVDDNAYRIQQETPSVMAEKAQQKNIVNPITTVDLRGAENSNKHMRQSFQPLLEVATTQHQECMKHHQSIIPSVPAVASSSEEEDTCCPVVHETRQTELVKLKNTPMPLVVDIVDRRKGDTFGRPLSMRQQGNYAQLVREGVRSADRSEEDSFGRPMSGKRRSKFYTNQKRVSPLAPDITDRTKQGVFHSDMAAIQDAEFPNPKSPQSVEPATEGIIDRKNSDAFGRPLSTGRQDNFSKPRKSRSPLIVDIAHRITEDAFGCKLLTNPQEKCKISAESSSPRLANLTDWRRERHFSRPDIMMAATQQEIFIESPERTNPPIENINDKESNDDDVAFGGQKSTLLVGVRTKSYRRILPMVTNGVNEGDEESNRPDMATTRQLENTKPYHCVAPFVADVADRSMEERLGMTTTRHGEYANHHRCVVPLPPDIVHSNKEIFFNPVISETGQKENRMGFSHKRDDSSNTTGRQEDCFGCNAWKIHEGYTKGDKNVPTRVADITDRSFSPVTATTRHKEISKDHFDSDMVDGDKEEILASVAIQREDTTKSYFPVTGSKLKSRRARKGKEGDRSTKSIVLRRDHATMIKPYEKPLNQVNSVRAGERLEQLLVPPKYRNMAAAMNPFPLMLYEMLDQAEIEGFDNVIGWDSSGKAFRIKDPIALEKEVLPRFFKIKNYRSFLRQLHLYGFFRYLCGSRQGLCYHKLFRRGEADRLRQIQLEASSEFEIRYSK